MGTAGASWTWFWMGMAVVVALVGAFPLILVRLSLWRREKVGRCVRCGYDLVKIDAACCPECGRARTQRVGWRDRWWHPWRLTWVILLWLAAGQLPWQADRAGEGWWRVVPSSALVYWTPLEYFRPPVNMMPTRAPVANVSGNVSAVVPLVPSLNQRVDGMWLWQQRVLARRTFDVSAREYVSTLAQSRRAVMKTLLRIERPEYQGRRYGQVLPMVRVMSGTPPVEVRDSLRLVVDDVPVMRHPLTVIYGVWVLERDGAKWEEIERASAVLNIEVERDPLSVLRPVREGFDGVELRRMLRLKLRYLTENSLDLEFGLDPLQVTELFVAPVVIKIVYDGEIVAKGQGCLSREAFCPMSVRNDGLTQQQARAAEALRKFFIWRGSSEPLSSDVAAVLRRMIVLIETDNSQLSERDARVYSERWQGSLQMQGLRPLVAE